MDCIGTNMLSGDGGNMSWFLRHLALLPKHQHQDEHRLLTGKSSALWENCWIGKYEMLGRNCFPTPPSQLAQDAGSSMLYMWI